MVNEYYKSRLPAHQRKVYEDSVRVFSEGGCRVHFTTTHEQAFDTYTAVYNDHPELFYMSNGAKAEVRSILGGIRCGTLISEHIYTPHEIIRFKTGMKRELFKLRELTRGCTSQLEVEKIVCDYIIENVTYSVNHRFHQNAASVLVNFIGQCSGISKAVKYLFDNLGIECIYVTGEGGDPTGAEPWGPHAWNIVKIDGVYYHLDVTFMLGCNPLKKKPYYRGYLNWSDADMADSHGWKRGDFPACTSSMKGDEVEDLMTIKREDVGDTVISSYAEFRVRLTEALEKRAPSLCFTSEIAEPNQKRLMQRLMADTKLVAEKLGVGMGVSLTCQNNRVKLEFTWSDE